MYTISYIYMLCIYIYIHRHNIGYIKGKRSISIYPCIHFCSSLCFHLSTIHLFIYISLFIYPFIDLRFIKLWICRFIDLSIHLSACLARASLLPKDMTRPDLGRPTPAACRQVYFPFLLMSVAPRWDDGHLVTWSSFNGFIVGGFFSYIFYAISSHCF